MSHVYSSDPTSVPVQATGPQEASLGTLVSQMSSQIPELIRSEIRLAQAEVTEKGKRAGIGLGMFSAAAVLGLFGLGVLITTAILLLDLVMSAWAAALVVAVVLLAAAGAVALIGKKKVAAAGPPTPARALENLKEDVATVKDAAARGERR